MISQTGKRLEDFPVETKGRALAEAARMTPGHEHLVFEEGLQSAWLYETLSVETAPGQGVKIATTWPVATPESRTEPRG